MSHSLPTDVISDLESRPPITFAIPTLAYLNARGALIVAISHPFPPLSTVIKYKKVVCGCLWWFAVVWVVCGGLGLFAVFRRCATIVLFNSFFKVALMYV